MIYFVDNFGKVSKYVIIEIYNVLERATGENCYGYTRRWEIVR